VGVRVDEARHQEFSTLIDLGTGSVASVVGSDMDYATMVYGDEPSLKHSVVRIHR